MYRGKRTRYTVNWEERAARPYPDDLNSGLEARKVNDYITTMYQQNLSELRANGGTMTTEQAEDAKRGMGMANGSLEHAYKYKQINPKHYVELRARLDKLTGYVDAWPVKN